MCKNDWYIIAIIILLALIGFLLQLFTNNSGDEKVFVYNDNNLLYSTNLSQMKNSFRQTFTTEKHFVELEFNRDKGVRVVNSSCKDKICQYRGYVNSNKQSIVCLPAKIHVQIQSSKTNEDLDATVY